MRLRAVRFVRSILRSAFLRDTGNLTAASLATAMITVVQGVIVARWLGPAGYGVFVLVGAYPAIALALISPDSPHATVRYLAARDTAADPVGALAVCKLAHAVDIAVGTVAFLAVAATAPWAEQNVVQADGVAGLLVLTAAALVIAVPGEASTSVLVYARRFGVLAVERVAASALRAALIIGVVAAGQGPAGAVRAAALGSALHGLALAWLAAVEARRRWGSWWPYARTGRLGPIRREMLRFMVWTDLGATLGSVSKQLDLLILGWISGPAEAGYYRLARSVAALPGHVVGPLQAATYPRLARQWAKSGWAKMRDALRRHARLGAGLGVAGLVGVGLLPPVIRGLAGPNFGPSIAVAQVLLIGSLVWLACYWLRPVFMAVGEVRAWVGISTAVVLGSLVAFIPAAAAGGAIGIALVQLAAAFVGHVIALLRLRRVAAVQQARPTIGVGVAQM